MSAPLRLFALAVTISLTAPLLLACGGGESHTTAGQVYGARGVVRGIDLGNRSITIEHEDVPGYMPAMTMPFSLTSPEQATGIAVGDTVRFRFRPEGSRHVVVELTKE